MNNLKQLREDKGISQIQLIEEIAKPPYNLKVSRRTLQYWESGERDIKTDKAKTLAKYFGVQTQYVLGYGFKKPIEFSEVDAFLKEQKEENVLNKYFIDSSIKEIEYLGFTVDDIKPHIKKKYKAELSILDDFKNKTEEEHQTYIKNMLYEYLRGIGSFIQSDADFIIRYLTLSSTEKVVVNTLVKSLSKK